VNRLPGRILRVESAGDLSLVDLDVGGHVLSALVLDTPASAPHLVAGAAAAALFKETEVMLARPGLGPISARNRLACRVIGREAGNLVTHFRLDFRSASGGAVLHSLITTRSAGELGLQDGEEVVALIKSTEVILEKADPPGKAAP
jgi:molybdate transport system regulatory protein